jgi:hypothetical protein
LDPDLLIQNYRAQFDPLPPPPDVAPRQESAKPELNVDPRRATKQAIGLAIVVLIGFAYFRFVGRTTASHAATPTPTHADLATGASAPVPVATGGALETARDTTSNVPLKIEFQATGPCWVSVSTDGEHVVGRLLNAGERQEFAVHDELTVRVGDPSTFTFTIDGVPGNSLGAAATPVNAHITRQNYKTFLAIGSGAQPASH